MPPCERQGLHLEPSQFQVAVKWWLGLDTSGDAQCALCPEKSLDPLGHHATTCKRGGDVVYHHNRLRDIVAESCRRAHLSVHLEVGHNLTPDHSNTQQTSSSLTGAWASLRLWTYLSLLRLTHLPFWKRE